MQFLIESVAPSDGEGSQSQPAPILAPCDDQYNDVAMTNSVSPRKRRSRPRPDGFVVVAVLWILAALAALVTIYMIYVINTAMALRVHDDRLQVEALITAALELTTFHMTATATAPSIGNFEFRLGNANVAVEFRSEAARIDLNLASKELLSGLLTALGTKREIADDLAAHIVAWRMPAGDRDPEAASYRTAGRDYRQRGAPFPHVEELSLVLGFPPELVERVLPFLTVYSGRPEINVIAAEPQVIAAIPGMTPDRLYAILAQRRNPRSNPTIINGILGPLEGFATTQSSSAVRVNVGIQPDNGRRSSSEVVILIVDDGRDPYRILSWRDDPRW
jgi:general secretion pathway protein K